MEDVTGSQGGHRGDSREGMGVSTGTAGSLWEHPGHETPIETTFPEGCKHTECGMHWLLAGNQWDNPGKCGGGDTHPSSGGRTGSTAQEMGWRSHPLGFCGWGKPQQLFAERQEPPEVWDLTGCAASGPELTPHLHGSRFWEYPVCVLKEILKAFSKQETDDTLPESADCVYTGK